MKSFLLNDQETASAFVSALVERSIEFTCTPLPEEEYEVSVENDVAYIAKQELQSITKE